MRYENLKRIFFKFEPEKAHKIAELAMRSSALFDGILSITAKNFVFNDEILHQKVLGNKFYNPIGLAGGFDKNATMLSPLCSLGFGFLEYGTVTKIPQEGNEKPRLFRLIEDKSLQNSMGFNNDGAAKIAKNLEKKYPFCIPLIANIGKNKDTPLDKAIDDYEYLIKHFNNLCDMFVINISSPNTQNLRLLQEEDFISNIAQCAKEITSKPIILKIAPDMEIDKALNLTSCAVKNKIDAIIINNTSTNYSISPNIKIKKGGISGDLIKELSKEMFSKIAREFYSKITLISCGGIDNAQETYERIKLGANLVEIFTSFIFQGPSVCKNINCELSQLIQQDGFNNISEAVGIYQRTKNVSEI